MPSGRHRPVYYWDTCAFIRYIAGRAKGPEIYDALVEVAGQVQANNATLFTSSFTRTELSETRMRPAEFAIYDALMQRRNVSRISYDDQIAHLGSALQAELTKRGKKLSIPDLIHLATAVYGAATELHTTDVALKACNGEAAVKGVRILTPMVNQYRLF
ncbi:MAG TPA: PIN domain-containing protein [Thermoanaerobaculia bacterium]|nr:PIN domain-containing protein [Thermoanaerobaculia bacterium]